LFGKPGFLLTNLYLPLQQIILLFGFLPGRVDRRIHPCFFYPHQQLGMRRWIDAGNMLDMVFINQN
jgi:hypothetical protein